MKPLFLITFFTLLPAFMYAEALPQTQTPSTIATVTANTSQPTAQTAPQENETAAIVLQAWGKLAGNMVNIIKDPNNVANVATNVGQLCAGFANILSEIVTRDGKNNLGNLMAMLENPEVQEWLVQEITRKSK